MSNLIKEILNIINNSQYEEYNYNRSYYDINLFKIISKKRIILFNLDNIINKYLDILIKYNKTNINDLTNEQKREDQSIFYMVDKSKYYIIYEKIINARYLYDTIINFTEFRNIFYRYYDLHKFNDNIDAYINITSFSNDFYKVLLTSDKINNEYLKYLTSVFNVDKKYIYKEIYNLAISFYHSGLSLKEYINKDISIKSNYKRIFVMLIYLNNSGIYFMSDNYKPYSVKLRNFIEPLIYFFCTGIIKEVINNKGLNIVHHNYDMKGNNILDIECYGFIKAHNPELLNKTIINFKFIYDILIKHYDNINIIFIDDFIKEVKKLYQTNIDKESLKLIKEYNEIDNYNQSYKQYMKIIEEFNNYYIKFIELLDKIIVSNDKEYINEIFNKLIKSDYNIKPEYDDKTMIDLYIWQLHKLIYDFFNLYSDDKVYLIKIMLSMFLIHKKDNYYKIIIDFVKHESNKQLTIKYNRIMTYDDEKYFKQLINPTNSKIIY